MTVDVRSYPFSQPVEAPAALVRITPTRRQIDDRFPVLAFTVDSGGRPFFEVLLTSDRTLFDGANAARRTASNFFASREHGLLRGGSEPAVYHVPTAVLQSFAGSREIFYTAAGYDSDRAANPAYAMPPELLATSAPSIALSADFRGRTTASMLSVPIAKLMRVRDDGIAVAAYDSPLVAPSGGDGAFAMLSLDADADDDRAGGEDGYGETAAADVAYDDGYTASAYGEDSAATPPEEAYCPAPQALAGNDDDYQDGFDGPVEEAVAPSAGAAQGYGDEAEWAEEPEVAAQESSFPAGAVPPAMLDDEDERERYGDEEYAASYTDEDDHAPAYQPLDAPQRQELTPQEQIRIMQFIGREFESGAEGYSSAMADGEFRGLFANHPAIDTWHVGLTWGLVQFTQDSGGLGEVLKAMKQRDAAKFAEIFGSDADEMLRVATASGPSSRLHPPRGPRVQPVGGKDLWEEPWLSRFRTAGKHPAFQAAQNEVAARIYIEPIRPFARRLGLDSHRALTMVVDRSIQNGPGGARSWILKAASPLGTDALRSSALRVLGHGDLRSFQRAVGIHDDGAWGPETHAAMLGALRALPAGQSPVPIPTREQMLDAMVRKSAAEHRRWAHRPAKLRTSTELSDDVVYAL